MQIVLSCERETFQKRKHIYSKCLATGQRRLNAHLFDTGREICDDFQDVIGLSEVFTDVRLISTDHSNGQTWTCST